MRIAYLVSQYPAASHTFIRREVEALRARGVEIDTFSINRPSKGEREKGPDRVAFETTYYVLPPTLFRLISVHARAISTRPLSYLRTLGLALRHRVPGVKALVWSLFHFAEAILVARELERRADGHLHNHFANSGANVGLLASSYLGIPWSLTLHGISETDYPAGLLLGAKLKAAAFVACVSYFGRAQAMRTVSPEYWDKFTIVRCALDLSVLPARDRAVRTKLRVICVGRLSPEKGHLGLLEAFRDALARGHDAELVLVGDGPELERIEKSIERLQIGASVQMLGRLSESDTLAEVAKSDLLVLASFMEGLPVVLMEALALGLPVIAPRVAGVPELVEHGRHGLLFTPADWQDLTENLCTMLANGELRERLGREGRAKVEAEFEIGKAVVPLETRYLAT
jgi:glycosyltransferase involved in cell wall biosynthesis